MGVIRSDQAWPTYVASSFKPLPPWRDQQIPGATSFWTYSWVGLKKSGYSTVLEVRMMPPMSHLMRLALMVHSPHAEIPIVATNIYLDGAPNEAGSHFSLLD